MTTPTTSTEAAPKVARAAGTEPPGLPDEPARPKPDVLAAATRTVGGYGFAVVLLVILTLLTLFGTIHQIDHGLFETQKKFFDSLFFRVFVGPFGIPIPGARLVLLLLAVNLVVGGLIRIRKSTATAGIIIAHIGILMLLLAGEVKFSFAREGHVKLWPNETQSEFQSYYDWEVEVSEQLPSGSLQQWVIPHEDFAYLDPGQSRRFVFAELPFDLTLVGYTRNAWPVAGGPGSAGPNRGREVGGWRLEQRPINPSAENNFAGTYAVVTEKTSRKQHEMILWGVRIDRRTQTLADPLPATFEVGGKRYGVRLRHKTWELPFAIKLEKFTRVLHPGTMRPKSFESDVIVTDEAGRRPVNISMNEPLRQEGHVVYQSGWGPQDPSWRGELYSDFAVADNPADKWPEIACWVIALGLLVHFGAKLLKYIRAERVRTQRVEAAS